MAGGQARRPLTHEVVPPYSRTMLTVALTIAGSDPSGGAGLQADLKTFAAWGVYGAAVVTALTAQNTRGVHGIHLVPATFVRAQLDAVLDDVTVHAIKTGMLPDGPTVEAVVAGLVRYPELPLVVDPVLVSTSGHTLADASALDALRRLLLPRAHLVTPNLPEAEALTGKPVRSRADMAPAARALVDLGARAALVTGGHLAGSACDVLLADGQLTEFDGPRLTVASTHGTGCTLSAAIAAALARGESLPHAVGRAKRYVTRGLARALDVGHGLRPLDHAVDPDDG
jgi:hydroxymethylpyrimidine/phosphomethylpyrimidine kinase